MFGCKKELESFKEKYYSFIIKNEVNSNLITSIFTKVVIANSNDDDIIDRTKKKTENLGKEIDLLIDRDTRNKDIVKNMTNELQKIDSTLSKFAYAIGVDYDSSHRSYTDGVLEAIRRQLNKNQSKFDKDIKKLEEEKKELEVEIRVLKGLISKKK